MVKRNMNKFYCIIKSQKFPEVLDILMHFGRLDYNITWLSHYFYIYEDHINYEKSKRNKNDVCISWDEYKEKYAEEFI